ncbi:MAG: site-specific integrase, partial [Rickettsiales bacterium]|nr:site-specific integrase [Rickettsiales bacterium]
MDYLNSFIEYIKTVKGLSSNTVESYRRDLELLLGYLGSERSVSVENCDLSDLNSFLDHFSRHYKNRTLDRL